jgi:glycine oxidase
VRTTPRAASYDAVVIGAGIVGLSCAWRAAQRGMAVLVLDREQPGAGASGVAAGMLAPVTEAEFGEQRLLALNLESAALWPGFSAELAERSGAATGYRESGALVVAVDRDDAEEIRRLHELQRSLGLEAEWLSGRACRRLEPGLSPRVAGGVHAPQDRHVDPAAVIAALVRALEAAGGEVVVDAADVSVEISGDRVTGVRTKGGQRVSAGQVVPAPGCSSAELAGLPPDARPPVRPVKGQILRLRLRRGAGPVAERIVRTPRCYVVSRGDGRVVVGATVEERGYDTAVTADGVFRLLEAAREALPDVGELELVEAGAGLRPGSPDNAPLIGTGALEGLVWATGHYRNGVLLAPLTAEAVAELLTTGEVPPTLRDFAPERFATRCVTGERFATEGASAGAGPSPGGGRTAGTGPSRGGPIAGAGPSAAAGPSPGAGP